MYFPSLPNPRAFEPVRPSLPALFREEYMTTRRERKPRRKVVLSVPVDTTSIRIEPLLGTQFFAYPIS